MRGNWKRTVLDEDEREDLEGGKFDKKLPKINKANVLRLIKLAKPEIWLIVVATFSLFVAAVSNLALPQYAGSIVDALAAGGGEQQLNKALFSLMALFVLGAIFTFLRAYLFTLAGERVVARLRKDLFLAVIRQEIGFFDKNRTGELINRLSADTSVLQNTVTANISMGLRWTAQVIGALGALFFISWKLTLVMIAVVPLIAISTMYYGRFVRRMSKGLQDALAKSTEVAEEAISNVRTVRSFSRELFEHDRYGEKVNESYKKAKNLAFAYGAFAGGVGFFGSLGLILVLWYGGKLVISGDITTGVLTSFLLYTLTVAFSLAGISGLYGDFMRAVGATERVFELIDRKATINISGGEIINGMKGYIEFDNVVFNYPSRPESTVLKGINLKLEPGKKLALVGPSGGGKSTIANLIERFYDPIEGVITIDGFDIKKLDPEWLHKKIAIVSQEPVLFATSIEKNICYGRNDVSFDQIQAAARMANAHEFIEKFPQKYETTVGEKGIRLSGGQKQRVAIARALILDPIILLLDEATSALDSESEHLVQEALERLMIGRTVIVIAHRLSTVKNADSVAVVNDGKIVEQGTHNNLLEKNGLYKQLVKRQLQWADKGEKGSLNDEEIAQ